MQAQALQQRALLAVRGRQQGIGGTRLARRGTLEEGQPCGVVEREGQRGAGWRPEEVLQRTGVGEGWEEGRKPVHVHVHVACCMYTLRLGLGRCVRVFTRACVCVRVRCGPCVPRV